jgi:hypothetical protein
MGVELIIGTVVPECPPGESYNWDRGKCAPRTISLPPSLTRCPPGQQLFWAGTRSEKCMPVGTTIPRPSSELIPDPVQEAPYLLVPSDEPELFRALWMAAAELRRRRVNKMVLANNLRQIANVLTNPSPRVILRTVDPGRIFDPMPSVRPAY